ncbi:hypothetical protein [Aurantimonas coralicida]|uniref:hypothetical protein n=1 Tax=Aurantimonas coralicida TaxID=182270 RepID=UPI0003F9B111|nr:hypothetical protein [Aurantimonas coralicida]
MPEERRKWDGDEPAAADTDDKEQDQRKKDGKSGVPDFDRSATDPDVIKHDGP